jgi:hypothetical protein
MNIKLTRITGPQNGFGHMKDIQGIKDLLDLQDEYLAEQKQQTKSEAAKARCGEPQVMPYAKLIAYVNESRLLVDCPCGSGVLVDAVNEIGCCLFCGAIYRNEQLGLPSQEELERVEESFEGVHPNKRHWDPRQHGIGFTFVGDE